MLGPISVIPYELSVKKENVKLRHSLYVYAAPWKYNGYIIISNSRRITYENSNISLKQTYVIKMHTFITFWRCVYCKQLNRLLTLSGNKSGCKFFPLERYKALSNTPTNTNTAILKPYSHVLFPFIYSPLYSFSPWWAFCYIALLIC